MKCLQEISIAVCLISLLITISITIFNLKDNNCPSKGIKLMTTVNNDKGKKMFIASNKNELLARKNTTNNIGIRKYTEKG